MIKKKLLTVGVILVSQSALLHAELSESSPNIICILADDVGYLLDQLKMEEQEILNR
mgnify:FL=1